MKTATREPAKSAGAVTEPRCLLCGSAERRLRFRQGPHSVLDCSTCGLTYVSPRRESAALLREVYDAQYWRSPRPRERGYGDYRGDRELYARTFERRWAAVRRHLAGPGRALDVGCAAGEFLAVLASEGWEVLGLEPSESMAETAAERLGPGRVRAVTLEEAELEAGSFDLVALWDVLEHLPAPLAALRRVRELLAPGGKLVLETQDIRSPVARLCGRRWHHFKHDEHLAHFHPGTLRRALEEAGLCLVELGRRHAGKYVRGDFVVERSARLHPRLPGLLRPWLGGAWSAYVNLGDEMIAVAEVAP